MIANGVKTAKYSKMKIERARRRGEKIYMVFIVTDRPWKGNWENSIVIRMCAAQYIIDIRDASVVYNLTKYTGIHGL